MFTDVTIELHKVEYSCKNLCIENQAGLVLLFIIIIIIIMFGSKLKLK